jgi:hypothetical protein
LPFGNSHQIRPILGRSAQSSAAFQDQTRINVNYSINAVAKLLAAMDGED